MQEWDEGGRGAPGMSRYHTIYVPGGSGYEDAKGGHGYGYANPGDFMRPSAGYRDSMSSTSSFPIRSFDFDF